MRLQSTLRASMQGRRWVEAPCFSRGKLDFSPAEKKSILKRALAPGFSMPGAKARDHNPNFSRSAEALLPPHKCGGSHQEQRLTGCTVKLFAACEAVPLQSKGRLYPRFTPTLEFC